MSITAFSKAYAKLNPQQKLAVDHIEGAVMVIAGPGTGKTQMLTLRIAKILLETDTQPENILALTFTEAGVSAMRTRLISIIGATAYRVNIFTFHGFANHCIQQNPDHFPHLINSTPITDIEQVEVLEDIFTQTKFEKIKNFADPFTYLSAARSAITELKRENITPDKFAQILDQQKIELEQIEDLYHQKGRYVGQMKSKYQKEFKEWDKNHELLQVYRLYQEKLNQLKYFDYEDMLLEMIDQLETNTDFQLQIQEQYHYFLIDEHQDTNRSQNRIIELISNYHPNPNVFVVGDEKQAIYRFQGASLTNFLYLKQNYPEAKVISLVDNYRSSQIILDTAHNLIEHSPIPGLDLPLRQNLQSQVKTKQTQIQIVDTTDFDGEFYFVAEDILKAIDSGTPANEIAILSRTNADLHMMMMVLKQKAIPFVLRANQNILDDLNVQKLICLLRLVTEPGNDLWLLQTLLMDICPVHPLDSFNLQVTAKETKQSLWSIFAKLEKINQDWIDLDKLVQWRDQVLLWIKAANNQHPDETFTQLLKESGLLAAVLDRPDLVEGLDRVISLYHQLRSKQGRLPQMSLADFVSFIDLVEQHKLKISGGVGLGGDNAVQLMTAHGSKGLEFDRVYILNCYDKKWGNNYSRGAQFKLPYEYMGTVISSALEDDKNADERRLFYVALTRARSHVTISYAKQNYDGRDQVPSQFIEELDEALVSSADTSDFEAKWRQNRHQILEPLKSTELSSTKLKESLQPKVAQMFEAQGFSVSGLNNYLDCPWRYFFRNLLRIPETKSLTLVFGSGVHESINRWVRSGGDGQSLIKFFAEYLKHQPLSDIQHQELLSKAQEVLPWYYQEQMQHWPKNLVSELKVVGVGIEPDIKLTGKLDLLIPIKTNQTSKSIPVQVVDFKTGKPKSRNVIEGKTKDSNGDYKRQLVFYQMLLDRFHNGKYKMVEGVLDFVQPNDSGKFKSERFSIQPEETKELEKIIINTAKEIRSLDFWSRRCDDQDCEYCSLREMMA